jgi:hypothetical protein
MIRLVSDTHPGPCTWRIAITRVEGKGSVVKKPKARLGAWADA